MNSYQKKPDAYAGIARARKERQCLMCRQEFTSEWSGERVCPKCKGSSAWREGLSWPTGSQPA